MSTAARSAYRRDAVFAAFLALVLSTGVLGVLLLNTSMQQQSQAMVRSHERLAELAEQAQLLQTDLDWTSDPSRLAAKARALRLRPVQRVQYVRVTKSGDRISERRRAASRAHGG